MSNAAYLVDGIGCWQQRTSRTAFPADSPALFLDRDGVVMKEAHFPKCAADVRLTRGAGEAVARANRASIPTILITNQSGIGRGYFGWDAFVEVQTELLRQLAEHGAHIDLVMACGYYGKGVPPFDVEDHAWRKPAPGMLVQAAHLLPVDLLHSFVIGDRMSDLLAGRAAGLKAGAVVRTGHGADVTAKLSDSDLNVWRTEGFELSIADTMAKAVDVWLRSNS